MKRPILRALGAALGYFAIFLGTQIVISALLSTVLSAFIGFEIGLEMSMGGAGVEEMLDPEQIAALVEERLLSQITALTPVLLLISQLITLPLLALPSLLRREPILPRLSLRPARGGVIAGAMGLGVCFNLLVQLVFSLLPASWLQSYADSSAMLSEAHPVLLLLTSVLLAPIVEEILFRALIQGSLSRAMPAAAAIAITSVLFGAAHGDFIWFLYAAALGVMLSLLMHRTGSLFPSLAMHFGFNLCGFVLPYLLAPMSDLWAYLMLGVFGVGGSALLVVLLWHLTRKREKGESLDAL